MFATVHSTHADPEQLAKAFTRLYIATRDERHAEEASKWREHAALKAWSERVKGRRNSSGMVCLEMGR